VRANFGNLPGRDAHPRIRSAIRRALDLDPNLGPAHVIHGLSLAWHDADWTAADRELRTAFELSPQNVWVHLYSAAFLSTARRADEILEPFERARELDPLNPMIHAHGILFSFYAGRPDRAIDEARTSRELFPDYWLIDYFEALVCWQRRDVERAVMLIEKAVDMTGQSIPYLVCYAAAIHFSFGNTNDGERWH
jgi:tetratricopeptide (TPR) repeat protein